MSKASIRTYFSLVLAAFLLPIQTAWSQVDSLIQAGDNHHRAYRFSAAADDFDEALAQATDTTMAVDSDMVATIRERMLLSQNGENMSRFVQKPKVIARERFALDDFFLFYPLENRSWRTLPNVLDSETSSPFVRALYAPDWNNVHYYSTVDEARVRSIFMTEQQDTVWTVPVKVQEVSTSFANEIYPMLSPDGKTLYFASDGLYGVGGYDLYKSVWDDSAQCWSMPQNMGFPYSSPADDFLFMDSEDGKYSVFASNRDCAPDSVWVYVLEYEKYPLHSSMSDPDDLKRLSLLMPLVKEQSTGGQKSMDDELTLIYMTKMDRVRALKDSLASVSNTLDGLRENLAFSHDAEERFDLSEKILALEASVPHMQKSLDAAKQELQTVEYEFLKKGVYVTRDEQGVSSGETETDIEPYHFARSSYGDSLNLNILVPEVKFDYSFRILDEALFAEDQSLPDGITYQIQLFSGSRKATLSELKGLCPVYEHRTPNGMYIYRVGRFTSYEQALEKVYDVRRLGFKGAYLCAFSDGHEVSVAQARVAQAEKNNDILMYEVRVIPDSGELEAGIVDGIVTRAIGKDLVRHEAGDGTQIFVIGPFDNKDNAEELADYIRTTVSGNVSCELVGTEMIQ